MEERIQPQHHVCVGVDVAVRLRLLRCTKQMFAYPKLNVVAAKSRPLQEPNVVATNPLIPSGRPLEHPIPGVRTAVCAVVSLPRLHPALPCSLIALPIIFLTISIRTVVCRDHFGTRVLLDERCPDVVGKVSVCRLDGYECPEELALRHDSPSGGL